MGTQVQKARSAVASKKVRPMSSQVAEVRNNINLIQEAMRATMKDNVHYGKIPGCPKPSLFKAGSEVILALFKLSTDPVITDLSTEGEIRYHVKVNITNRDGKFIGSGVGECSSGEEKYMWRGALCNEEYESFPENMRRIKFRKDRNGDVHQIPQVRVNPGDMANTILKMAKKRAQVDAVLTATGASDIFSQDIEDLPEGYIPPEAVEHPPVQQAPSQQPKPAAEDAASWPVDEEGPSNRPSLIDAGPGDTIMEVDLLVNSVQFDPSKGKSGLSTIACEDDQGNEFHISKWGPIKEDIAGSLCTFLIVKVSEWEGTLQYRADKVVAK